MFDGKSMYDIAAEIFPICRSITGNGVRETLSILKKYAPEMTIHEVPSGTKVFDWTVPKEWNIRDAYIEDENGDKIIDFKKHNLHVMGYSLPMDEVLPLEELEKIIYTEKNQPDVIPYVTSYYKERSGFCMSENQRKTLKPGNYHAYIDSELTDGSLTYAECYFPGKTDKEIFISTYVCHPSMANNECSGPALSVGLMDYVRNMKDRYYSYRFIFVTETIGSITYLSKNYLELKKKVVAGFNLSCVGDNRTYSFISTRYANTITDKVLRNVLKKLAGDNYTEYSYLKRGSDERQYNAPGIDLPVCSFCRSKYGEFPEYHTSADDLSLISPEGFQGAYDCITSCFKVIEANKKYIIKVLCEPQLGKRGLYPTVSHKGQYDEVYVLTNFIAYCDGNNDILDISDITGTDALKLIEIANVLMENDLLEVCE